MSCSRCQQTLRGEAKAPRRRVGWAVLAAALVAGLLVAALGPSAGERQPAGRAAPSAR